MALLSPDPTSCLRNNKCLSGANTGLTYSPSKPCITGYAFDANKCDCFRVCACDTGVRWRAVISYNFGQFQWCNPLAFTCSYSCDPESSQYPVYQSWNLPGISGTFTTDWRYGNACEAELRIGKAIEPCVGTPSLPSGSIQQYSYYTGPPPYSILLFNVTADSTGYLSGAIPSISIECENDGFFTP
jgi:hypothetical protein